MTWPKHRNPSSNRRKAKAPYNFVPLPERVLWTPKDPPAMDRYHPDRHTGWIECKLTTASPLYVRAALELEEFERSLDEKAEGKLPWREQVRNKPDFFYTEDRFRPVIPGSSLRGMLREMVEIVAFAKVQPVTKARLVYRAIGDTTSFGQSYRQRLMHEDSKRHFTHLMKAGYMEKDGYDWYIRPAQSIGGTTFARIWREDVPPNLPGWHGCRNARQIWIDPGPYEYKDVRRGFIKVKYSNVRRASASPGKGLVRGAWARSGEMFSKRFDMVVFPADAKVEPIHVPDELVMAYREQLTQEQIDLLGRNGVLRDQQPVFYLVEDGKLAFFGHTKMFRLPYPRSPLDFVPRKLRSDSEVDLAEAMFGYVGLDVNEPSRAGRVFVSDAQVTDTQSCDEIWLTDNQDEVIVPRILSGPKPTTFQHYLVQQTPDAQPAGKTKNGKPKYKVVLSHYASPTPDETVIRGHKLYWHKGDVSRAQIEETEEVGPKDTQHTQFKPVRSGVRFHFRIRFENLSPVELGALLWALRLPGSGEYRHKLGMGKPLGLGAVKIESELHLTDRHIRYHRLFDGGNWELGQKDSDNVEKDQNQALSAFERNILDDDDLNPDGKAQALAEVSRIQSFLAMVSWPGPPLEQTEYIAVLKEFTKRKVLPTPLRVIRDSKPTPPREIKPSKEAKERPQTPRDLHPGQVLEGEVRNTVGFGAFVDIGVGHDGLVHISELSDGWVDNVEDVVRVGQRVRVRVQSVEKRGKEWRIGLSMKGVNK